MDAQLPILISTLRGKMRSLRGWMYRHLPSLVPGTHRKRMIGYGRRWRLEESGWTQEGFCQVAWKKLLSQKKAGRILELAAGDGLVGSLGRWLEEHQGWSAECEEAAEEPYRQMKKNRPRAQCFQGLVLLPAGRIWDVITSRSAMRSAQLLREMRTLGIRPGLVGVWNRSGRSHWAKRLKRMGYRPVLCQDRMEFYQLR